MIQIKFRQISPQLQAAVGRHGQEKRKQMTASELFERNGLCPPTPPKAGDLWKPLKRGPGAYLGFRDPWRGRQGRSPCLLRGAGTGQVPMPQAASRIRRGPGPRIRPIHQAGPTGPRLFSGFAWTTTNPAYRQASSPAMRLRRASQSPGSRPASCSSTPTKSRREMMP